MWIVIVFVLLCLALLCTGVAMELAYKPKVKKHRPIKLFVPVEMTQRGWRKKHNKY